MDKFTLENIKSGQVLLFDKPLNWTSFQVVNKVRWLIRKQFEIKKIKVGHAGTLDPLATGLVILCTGKATKTIEDLMGQTKVYTGVFTLGATRPSYDMETEIDQTFPVEHITEAMILDAATNFVGDIQQQPPVFSALKKDGKRLYEYARKGEKVDIPTRQVNISKFEITEINFPEVHFKVICSKGTYIRSLAHDFGKALDSGAYLSELRRTKIGDFKVEDALSISEFEESFHI
ncbi:tRNA pseudouridine(55) synthase TruB [Psychroflexus aestuariivivens]|uniref:tRNA pseudouridine(55) synthase TruB n=1 Tax=Psychroflexus aestuariivivens TaxID=1795040 RepID=UPI000FD76C2C|nr:tRNA pseudouridine(55) synthase TruB [Psychroflexus aestuariivivens]